MVYSMILDEAGMVCDDVMVGGLSDGSFLMVVNASNKSKILDWSSPHRQGDVQVSDFTDKFFGSCQVVAIVGVDTN